MARYDTDGSSALAPNDPYNEMEGAVTRPNFQVIDGGKTTKSNNSSNRNNLKVINGGKANNSKDLLRNSENSAISKQEHESGSAWANNVTGRDLKATVTNGTVSKKKGGIYAFVIIIVLLCGGGAFLGSSHSMLAPAMESLMTEATDYQSSSFLKRFSKLVSFSNNHTTTSSDTTKKYTSIPASAEAKTTQGRVATFFDDSSTKTYDHLNLDRNTFRNYKQTNNSETDMENFRNTMSPEFEENSSSFRSAYDEEVKDGDGNVTDKKPVSDTNFEGKSNNSMDEATKKANDFIDSVSTGKIASTASQVGNATCAIMRVGATISAIVAANEIYQSIRYFMNYMENISKMKYGEGSSSAINEELNTLTTSVEATYPNLSNPDGQDAVITGAMVEANGMQMMLANAPGKTETTQNFSLERTSSAVMAALTISTAEMNACAGVQAGAAVVSIITTIGSLGTAAIGQVLFNISFSATISIATNLALSFLVPTIARTLFTNIFETTTGIPAGELLARGGSAANTRIGRSGSGQAPSTSDAILAYNRINQEMIAEAAEADRKHRSPFDITSKNTFLGSIAYKLLPITLLSAKSNKALISNVGTLARTTSSAIASLTNSASALSNSSYMTNFGNCPTLESIGAVGDIYCNPITITDPDPEIMDISPDNQAYLDAINSQIEGCDGEGNNCKIKADHDLARYITYCANRDSPFGIVDANIYGAIEKGNAVLGVIPVVGDIIDLVNSANHTETLAWATGQKCVANTATNPDWKTFKYYQRYIEDQRILEWAGAYGDEQNPVLAYEAQYEEEHPLDNSPAGYLARISGVTKENVEVALEIIEYYQFVEDYDPASRIAMLEEETSIQSSDVVLASFEKSTLHFEEQNDNPIIIANTQYYIVYDDLRNRNYVV